MNNYQKKKLKLMLLSSVLSLTFFNGCTKEESNKKINIPSITIENELGEIKEYTYLLNIDNNYDSNLNNLLSIAIEENYSNQDESLTIDLSKCIKFVWPDEYKEYDIEKLLSNKNLVNITYNIKEVNTIENKTYHIETSTIEFLKDYKTIKKDNKIVCTIVYDGVDIIAFSQTGMGSNSKNVIKQVNSINPIIPLTIKNDINLTYEENLKLELKKEGSNITVQCLARK